MTADSAYRIALDEFEKRVPGVLQGKFAIHKTSLLENLDDEQLFGATADAKRPPAHRGGFEPLAGTRAEPISPSCGRWPHSMGIFLKKSHSRRRPILAAARENVLTWKSALAAANGGYPVSVTWTASRISLAYRADLSTGSRITT